MGEEEPLSIDTHFAFTLANRSLLLSIIPMIAVLQSPHDRCDFYQRGSSVTTSLHSREKERTESTEEL